MPIEIYPQSSESLAPLIALVEELGGEYRDDGPQPLVIWRRTLSDGELRRVEKAFAAALDILISPLSPPD